MPEKPQDGEMVDSVNDRDSPLYKRSTHIVGTFSQIISHGRSTLTWKHVLAGWLTTKAIVVTWLVVSAPRPSAAELEAAAAQTTTVAEPALTPTMLILALALGVAWTVVARYAHARGGSTND